MADLAITHEEAVVRLRQLFSDVQARFGQAVTAEQEEEEWWTVTPRRHGSVGVTWYFTGELDLSLQVLTDSEKGGHWELLDIEADDVDWVRDMVWSIAEGRAEELLGPGRTTLRVTLSDGTVEDETGSGLSGLVPMPGWRSRAALSRYLPWLGDPAVVGDSDHP